MQIDKILARQVFDSRGIPTVEVELSLKSGACGRFITPSGASVGKNEALELRDGDTTRFLGRGVEKALRHVREDIARALCGSKFSSQKDLDDTLIALDGTPNKSRLGANAVLAVSGAFFHAHAEEENRPLYQGSDSCSLPTPLVNVINGGAHANNGLDIQEFMIVPTGVATFSDAMRVVAETFYALKAILQKSGFSTAVGDEGGFAPKLSSNEHALDLLMAAVEKAGYTPGADVKFALDVAANEMYVATDALYRLNGQKVSREQLLLWYETICSRYPICSIEDPFQEDDVKSFQALVATLGKKIQVVGDDLFVTNKQYIQRGIEHRYANAVLIKMNQIGTITETMEATAMAKSAGFNAIMSHRSGDSEDTTIADLAVKTAASQIKTGSLSRSERVAKYNRLLRIEEALKPHGSFKPFSIGGSL